MFQLLPLLEKHDRLKEQECERKAAVELYCTATCPFCRLVRNYFKTRDVDYLEFRVDINKVAWLEMEYRSQKSTVPQIFINGYHIGGYDELLELDQSGQLEKIL